MRVHVPNPMRPDKTPGDAIRPMRNSALFLGGCVSIRANRPDRSPRQLIADGGLASPRVPAAKRWSNHPVSLEAWVYTDHNREPDIEVRAGSRPGGVWFGNSKPHSRECLSIKRCYAWRNRSRSRRSFGSGSSGPPRQAAIALRRSLPGTCWTNTCPGRRHRFQRGDLEKAEGPGLHRMSCRA